MDYAAAYSDATGSLSSLRRLLEAQVQAADESAAAARKGIGSLEAEVFALQEANRRVEEEGAAQRAALEAGKLPESSDMLKL